MTDDQKKRLMSVGMGLAACFLIYRFGPNAMLKTAAVSVGAVIAAKQLPFIGPAINAA